MVQHLVVEQRLAGCREERGESKGRCGRYGGLSKRQRRTMVPHHVMNEDEDGFGWSNVFWRGAKGTQTIKLIAAADGGHHVQKTWQDVGLHMHASNRRTGREGGWPCGCLEQAFMGGNSQSGPLGRFVRGYLSARSPAHIPEPSACAVSDFWRGAPRPCGEE